MFSTRMSSFFFKMTLALIFVFSMNACRTLEYPSLMNLITDIADPFIDRKHTFTVLAPADYPDTLKINSIQVKSFSASSSHSKRYASRLQDMIGNGIAKEGYLSVVDRNADASVSGTLDWEKIQEKSYTTSSESDGKTTYTYYYVKKMSATGTYSLYDNRRGRNITGDSFSVNFEKKWFSYDSREEAEAEAMTDEQIAQFALDEIAKKVVFSVSPHKETVNRILEKGSDESVKLGCTYLENGRVDQAIAIWLQVIEKTEDVKDQAAAYYNIGVVKEAQGNYKEAFEVFTNANSLRPKKELYIKALTRVEEAKMVRDKREAQVRGTKK